MFASKSKFYDSHFYDDQKFGSLAAAKIILPWILTLFPNIQSVVDFGCGAGTWLKVLADNGKNIQGYDFGDAVPDHLMISKECFNLLDITNLCDLNNKYDLAISLEVAEHIDEKFADDYIKLLSNSANIILFSAAIPYQGGTHHVNCQWPFYWATKFVDREFTPLDIIRPVFWNIHEIPVWYRQNIMLFIKDKVFKNNDINQDINNYVNINCLPIIHPEMLRSIAPTFLCKIFYKKILNSFQSILKYL